MSGPSEGMAGQKSGLMWAVHIAVAALVLLWTIPTLGLFVTSLRTADDVAGSGWWRAFQGSEQVSQARTEPPSSAVQDGAAWVLAGKIDATVSSWGLTAKEPTAFAPGQVVEDKGAKITVAEDGAYRLEYAAQPTETRGLRLFTASHTPPSFSLDNYRRVLTAEGLGRSFLNTMTVTIPATVIPILIAAFAAFALAWMEFPGRSLLIAAVVGLLVVPLQLALIPLLRMHVGLGIGQSYYGVWLAHAAFGLPLAIYLLRNYMVGLPREIIESARVDGATDFQIFLKIILPLSFPALASFAIFQFLWVWNDLLVAAVFLGPDLDKRVMTSVLKELLGSRGGNWEILAASAFISIAVPLGVFFALQKYLVRGLLSGSVK